MTEFRGVNVAALTPRDEQGNLDFGASFELIDFLNKAGVNGIVLFGAQGEFPALTADERSRLVYLATKRSRVPVLAGVGSATLDLSIGLARDALDAGAAALLLPPPLFFPYDQDDIREFYLQFAAGIENGAPTFVSNCPAVSSEIAVETAAELLQTGLFAGMEDASGNLDTLCRLAACAPGCSLLVGDDRIFARARSNGARPGAISAVGCAVPELMMALDRAIAAGDHEETVRLDRAVQDFTAWMGRFPQPAIVKIATGLRGVKTGPLSVPLPAAKQKLADEFREWFQGWLPTVKRLSART
jgi:4-hydroxy-tetrahydrodipicolinate synthase